MVECRHGSGHHPTRVSMYGCRWRALNLTKARAGGRARQGRYVKDHKDASEASRARYLANHPGVRRSNRVLQLYGLTQEDYEKIEREQGGVCRICYKKSPRRALDIDHDHQIQQAYGEIVVRGLLCARCNRRVVGGLEYDDEVLRRGIAYLQNILDIRVRYRLEYEPLREQLATQKVKEIKTNG